MAGIAAERRSGTEIARIQRLFDAMYAARGDADAYTKADIAFHEALIHAAHNALLCQLMRPVNQMRRFGSILTIRHHPQRTADSMRGHHENFDAIATGDAAAARAAMARHISQFEHYLLDAIVLASQGWLADLDLNDDDAQRNAAASD